MQRVLKINITKRPAFFLLGFIENKLEETLGRLILCMVSAARLLHAQQYNTMEE